MVGVMEVDGDGDDLEVGEEEGERDGEEDVEGDKEDEGVRVPPPSLPTPPPLDREGVLDPDPVQVPSHS